MSGNSQSYPIPGYLGQLQIARSTAQDSGWIFSAPLPISAYQWGGGCQPRGIYLASGIPYPDVFPERETLTAWSFSGPARIDFNPWSNDEGYFGPLAPGTFGPGQLVAARFAIYGGTATFREQIGGSYAAFVADFHYSATSRTQAMWHCTLVAAWAYQALSEFFGLDDFRLQGGDTSYNIPLD